MKSKKGFAHIAKSILNFRKWKRTILPRGMKGEKRSFPTGKCFVKTATAEKAENKDCAKTGGI